MNLNVLGDLNYYYKDNVNEVAKCLCICHEPIKIHDVENNLCLFQCPYNKKYYTQDFICLIECNYFMQFETNECIENMVMIIKLQV